jgi:hypothetical protein
MASEAAYEARLKLSRKGQAGGTTASKLGSTRTHMSGGWVLVPRSEEYRAHPTSRSRREAQKPSRIPQADQIPFDLEARYHFGGSGRAAKKVTYNCIEKQRLRSHPKSLEGYEEQPLSFKVR